VSFIQSNYLGFGSGVVVPGTGISLQNRALGFSLDPRHPNCVAGGKRPYHTIMPGFATRDGRAVAAFGVMGGHMQPQGHVQMALRLFAQGRDPQAACDAPRWHATEKDEVALEARYPHQIELGERLGATQPTGLYDVVIEAAGSESALHRAAELAAPGGAMGVLGVFPPEVQWPQMLCFMKEVRSVPALGYCKHEGGRDFDQAAQLLASTPHLVDALVTHRFPIDDAPEAFRVASDKTTGALRVVVEPNP